MSDNNYIFHNEKLKNSFKNIISIKKEIGITKNKVSNQLNQLKKLHSDMIKENNKQIFLFCLDSFFYQYKIFSMEFEHLKKLRSILNNRMYCDYYKLHNIILKFCKEHIDPDLITTQTFPVYKDLEPFTEYRVEDIILLHDSILNLINTLYLETTNKEDAISHYNDNHKVGFSISNFLNTLTHENHVLQEQISLFINYISFFHISQKKQLKKLHNRMDEFLNEVNENINMNYTFSIDDIEEEDDSLEMVSAQDLIDEDNNKNLLENNNNDDVKEHENQTISPIQQVPIITDPKFETVIEVGDNNAVLHSEPVDLPQFKSITDISS